MHYAKEGVAHQRWGGVSGVGTSVGGGMSVWGCVAYPWGVNFDPDLVHGWQGGKRLVKPEPQSPILLRPFFKGSEVTKYWAQSWGVRYLWVCVLRGWLRYIYNIQQCSHELPVVWCQNSLKWKGGLGSGRTFVYDLLPYRFLPPSALPHITKALPPQHQTVASCMFLPLQSAGPHNCDHTVTTPPHGCCSLGRTAGSKWLVYSGWTVFVHWTLMQGVLLSFNDKCQISWKMREQWMRRSSCKGCCFFCLSLMKLQYLVVSLLW